MVNTCAFIEPAREESIQAILEAAELKKTGPAAHGSSSPAAWSSATATSCAASCPRSTRSSTSTSSRRSRRSWGSPRAGSRATCRSSPARDLGTPARGVGDRRVERGHVSLRRHDAAAPAPPRPGPPTSRSPRAATTPARSARSRRSAAASARAQPESVVAGSGRRSPRGGVREINLIAQDSSHYGRDLGLTDGLATLLERLDAIDGPALDPRCTTCIRTRSRDAADRGDGRARRASCPTSTCRCSTRIPRCCAACAAAARADGHLRLLERFRARAARGARCAPRSSSASPARPSEEFETLLEFVDEARFDHLGVFTYSHEEGTPAAALADDVPADVKSERRERAARAASSAIVVRAQRRIASGRSVEVLVEGAHPETEHLLVGRTRGQAPRRRRPGADQRRLAPSRARSSQVEITRDRRVRPRGDDPWRGLRRPPPRRCAGSHLAIATGGWASVDAPIAPGTFGSLVGPRAASGDPDRGRRALAAAVRGAVARHGARLLVAPDPRPRTFGEHRSGPGRRRRGRRSDARAAVPPAERSGAARGVPRCSACSTSGSRSRSRRLEALPGSSGIMADDLVAGLYANGLLQLARWLFPRGGVGR